MKITSLAIAFSLAATAFAADTTYKGYLVDTFCGSAGSSKMDGSDEINAPQEHTVACQIACAKGGYGVMVPDGKVHKFIPFDAKGSELAMKILKATKKAKGPTVVVTGTLKDGVIQVSALTES